MEVGPLRVVGWVRSELTDRDDAPRQADGAPPAAIVVEERYVDGLRGVEVGDRLVIITWLHLSERDVLLTHPRGDRDGLPRGVFATRSPRRPNPLGLHPVRVVAIDRNVLHVDHLEAVDGTPVVDIKTRLR